MATLLLTSGHLSASTESQTTPPTLSTESARLFGQLYMDYNDRICPVQTFALDFTKKLCGKRSYRGLSAEQVLAGFIFWSHEWSREPIIKVKSSELREAAQQRRRTNKFVECFRQLPNEFSTDMFTQVFGYANNRSGQKTLERLINDKAIKRTMRGNYKKLVPEL